MSSQGIGALSSLKHLRKFVYKDETFVSFESRNKSKEHFAMCLQLLPRLRVSCAKIKLQLRMDDFNTNFASKAFCLLRGQLPSRLGLRQLALHNAYAMPEGVSLPNLKTLFLFRPQPHFRLGGALESVTQLGLHRVRQRLLEHILGQLGHQIRKLSLSVGDTLHLDTVFALCPGLRVLYISDFPAHFFGTQTPLRESSLGRLSEFGFFLDAYDQRRHLFKTQHLLRLLRAAPNLRVLRAPRVFFNSRHADEDVSEALRQRSVLQKLEQLHFLSTWTFGPDMSTEDMFQRYQVLRNVKSHCPKLKAIYT